MKVSIEQIECLEEEIVSIYCHDDQSNWVKNVKEAVHCNLWVLTQSNYMNMVDVNSEYVDTMTWWRATYIAVEATSATLAGLCLALTVLTSILDKKKGRN